MSSMLVQIPVSILLVDASGVAENPWLIFCFVLNGIFFHFQSISAYVLMDYISPVTHRYGIRPTTATAPQSTAPHLHI
jgi:solute carrier family 35 protein E2